MDLINLPPTVLIQTVLYLPIDQVVQLCTTNPQLNQILCANPEFWQHKYLFDFGPPERIPLVWREAYHQKSGGQVYSFGWTESGQLGLGDIPFRNTPTLIPNIHNVKSVSAGNQHSLILTRDGQVYAFGSNLYGRLGLGHNINQNVPSIIPNLPKIKQISAGEEHSLVLSEEGQVYAFGQGVSGQLGFGNTPTLIPVPQDIRIKEISTRSNHNLILDEEGQVYAFGYNLFGQLGVGDNQTRAYPTLIPLPPDIKIKKISAGGVHSLLLDEQNGVWSFGWNRYGQLGLGDNQDRNTPTLIPLPQDIQIKEISTGINTSFILTQTGQAYAFGDNNDGKLGLGDNQDRNIPTLMLINNIKSISPGGPMNLVLTQDNRVYLLGRIPHPHELPSAGPSPHRNIPIPEPFFTPIMEVKTASAGTEHGLIVSGPFALFSTIQTLIQNNQIQNHRILSQSLGETLMEFIDIQGNVYLIKVRYDQNSGQIFPLSS